MASVEEIRRLLDDPNVAPHTKKDLLFDLIAMGGDENDPQALWRYAQQLGVPRDEFMDAVEQVVFDRAP
ncbi:MAG TPA: hypothetical protein VFT95_16935, partial [Micromonosporaceae bacterium]|nr:hypothetical protein [Micromonosporaceae bacterium]